MIATAAIHIGGRLQVVDENGTIVRLDPGRQASRRAGRLRLAQAATRSTRRSSTRSPRRMADALVAALTDAAAAARRRASLSDRSDRRFRPASTASCSPAASANTSTAARRAISATWAAGSARRSAARVDAGALPWPLLPAGECIRATALGASEYSVQLSGNTSYISNPGELLPRRNLQVLQPPFVCEEVIDAGRARGGDPRAFHRLRSDRGRGRGGAGAALAGRAVLRAHRRLRRGHPPRPRRTRIERRKPLYIMLDGDIAQTLGAILREELRVESEILVHRRRDAEGFRLHRSRPHPHAVEHRAGDDQVAGVQRGPARRPAARSASTITTTTITRMIMAHDHGHGHHHHDHDHDHDHARTPWRTGMRTTTTGVGAAQVTRRRRAAQAD